MRSPALGWSLRPYRPETRHPDWPVWPLALHVLFWVIKDLLGIRLEV